jgi:hypothetical protein
MTNKLSRTQSDRIATIKRLQVDIEKQKDIYDTVKERLIVAVVVCGRELISLHGSMLVGTFEPMFNMELERPGFGIDLARRYMQAARQLVHLLPQLAGSDPLTSKNKAALAELSDAKSFHQMWLDLWGGGDRQPGIGGNGALMAWLKEKHPRCKATKAADLPAEIRKEWEAHVKTLNDQVTRSGQVLYRVRWNKVLDKLDTEIRLCIPHLTSDERLKSVARLKDAFEFVKGGLK